MTTVSTAKSRLAALARGVDYRPLLWAVGFVALLGVFAAGYGVGFHDAFEESRVRSGEIKTPHFIVPQIYP